MRVVPLEGANDEEKELDQDSTSSVSALHCAVDGSCLAIGREDGSIALISMETGKKVAEVDMGEEPV